MSVGTLNTSGTTPGISAEEVVSIALANRNVAWTEDGCAAFVWGVTNLAGLPHFSSLNGDKTVDSDPRRPQDVPYAVPHSPGIKSGTADVAGDGWTDVFTENPSTSQLLTGLRAGDIVRVYRAAIDNPNEDSFVGDEVAAHSFIVVSNNGKGNVQIVDNWTGSTISQHSFDDIVNSWAQDGFFAAAFVSRIDSEYVNDNVDQTTAAGNGFGDFGPIPAIPNGPEGSFLGTIFSIPLKFFKNRIDSIDMDHWIGNSIEGIRALFLPEASGIDDSNNILKLRNEYVDWNLEEFEYIQIENWKPVPVAKVVNLLNGTLDRDDIGSTPATAGTLSSASLDTAASVSGVIETASDTDYFTVELVAGRSYAFVGMANKSDLNPTLVLHDLSGNVVAQNNDIKPGIVSAFISYTASTSGRHHVVISGSQGTTGAYLVVASDISDAPGSDLPFEAPEPTEPGDPDDWDWHGTSGGDNHAGSDSSERFRGHDGDDEIYGGGGHDVIWGDDGDDWLDGDDGNDVVKGGARRRSGHRWRRKRRTAWRARTRYPAR